MWAAIFISLFAAAGAGFVYLISCFRKFAIVRKIAGDKKWLSFVIGVAAVIIFSAVIALAMNMMNAIVCLLHLVLFWLICDFAGWIVRKCSKRTFKIYYAGICAVVLTAVYLCIGWYFAHHVYETDYTIETEKEIPEGELRVALIADSHVGTTFDGEGFAKYMKEIEAENPDVLLIAGDFVDDYTTKEDMLRCCQALGEFDTKYGVYFVFGNHDKGYYEGYRNFNADDLVAELQKNNVTVLQDEAVLVDNRFYIVGRCDASNENRADMQALLKDVDMTKYIIVMDHQPTDYDAEESCNVDLVLSGHTHGGQLIPITYAGEWLGVNDKTYGCERRSNTDFIVTSGIADWAIKFKTGCISEYVIIDIK